VQIVYKILSAPEWRQAEALGRFEGSTADRADGFIHLSTAGQIEETARRHFGGQDDLVLLAVEASALGETLRYEPSRGGDLFPHVYGPLPVAAVRWAKPLPLEGGAHRFPDLGP